MSKRKTVEKRLAGSSEDNLTHYLTMTADGKDKFISVAVTTDWDGTTGKLTVDSGVVDTKGVKDVKVFATVPRAVAAMHRFLVQKIASGYQLPNYVPLESAISVEGNAGPRIPKNAQSKIYLVDPKENFYEIICDGPKVTTKYEKVYSYRQGGNTYHSAAEALVWKHLTVAAQMAKNPDLVIDETKSVHLEGEDRAESELEEGAVPEVDTGNILPIKKYLTKYADLWGSLEAQRGEEWFEADGIIHEYISYEYLHNKKHDKGENVDFSKYPVHLLFTSGDGQMVAALVNLPQAGGKLDKCPIVVFDFDSTDCPEEVGNIRTYLGGILRAFITQEGADKTIVKQAKKALTELDKLFSEETIQPDVPFTASDWYTEEV